MGDNAYGAAGAVIGGVIGFYSGGNVVLGAQIGYGIGSQVDARENNKKSPRREPTLQNKQITTGEYGAPLPIAYGKDKVNGVLIWGTNIYQEVVAGSDDPGGKGGGSGGTAGPAAAKYNTFGRFAVKLCNGPIVGLSRLWLDGKLYLDARSSSTGAISQVGLGSTSGQVQSGKEEIAVSTSNGHVTIYTGTEEQAPNDFMESWIGVGQVNAHRGDAYLVFHTLLLDSFGKRIPNVTAEIIKGGSILDTAINALSLAEPSPLPAFPTRPPYDYQLSYDRFSGNIVWLSIVSNYASQPYTKVQLQAIRYGTHEPVLSVAVDVTVSSPSWTFYFNPDNSGPYIWTADTANVYAISMQTGAKLFTTPRSYSGFVASNTARVLSVTNANEIWITNGNNIFVFDRGAIISGSTLQSAYKRTTLSFQPGSAAFLYYAPHIGYVIEVKGGYFGFYDTAGNKVYGLLQTPQAGATIEQPIYVDEVNNCIWYIERDFSPDARELYKLDLSTFAFTLITTDCSYGKGVVLDTTRNAAVVYKYNTEKFEWYDGNGTKIKEIQTAHTGDAQSMVYVPSGDGIAYNLWASFDHGRVLYGYQLDRLESALESIDDILLDIGEKVGLSPSQMVVTEVSGDTVNGYAIDNRTQARAAIEPLKRIGIFDLVYEDEKVKARKFGGASVMTIDYQDLLIEDADDHKRPYSTKRTNEIDLPQSVEVAYSDVDFDYETQLQSASRSTRLSKSKAVVTIPAAITGDVAKRSAQIALYQAWASRTSWTLNGSRKHWALNIGDAFTFVDETGASRRLLCVGREMLGMTRFTITAVEDDASVYTSSATGSVPTWTPPVITAGTLKRLDLLDIPIMRDQDDYPGFYAVADSSAPTAFLYESIDGGITYNPLGAIQEADTGYATTTLADFTGGNVWDDVNTVTVTLYAGTLESVTDAQVLAGLNTALIGNEIIQYSTATLIATNTYTLSRLLRGRKGTEWAISMHGNGERFVPLPIAMSRISSSVRGALRYYKTVRSGASIADAPITAFTNSQAGMKPYSVVNVAGSRDGSNNLTITWARRSRIGTAWGVTDALPLDDTVESYQVDIMSGSVVKRTISSSTPTCDYSAADQTTDFGGVQLSLLVNVYQMSTIVGRGTVSAKTI